MIRIGITAGIGAGKTTVCQEFEKTMQIPVYYSDHWAKWLMVNDPQVKDEIIKLLGPESYQPDGLLNKKHIGGLIFNNKELEKKVQMILKVPFSEHLDNWCKEQEEKMSDCHYALIESAIFYETNTSNQVDLMIGVDAPLNMRIARAMKRDMVTEAEVMQRMKLQNHDENMKYCDFIIHNTNKEEMVQQARGLHLTLVRIAYLALGISVQRGGVSIRG